MIVAYHNKEIIYAYKGIFNFNIDHDWTGGILVNFTKIIDKCDLVESKDVQPVPSINGISGDDRLFGLAFAKQTPFDYWKNSDTIYGNFDSPSDARFFDCSQLPSLQKSQQTIAIYVRWIDLFLIVKLQPYIILAMSPLVDLNTWHIVY